MEMVPIRLLMGTQVGVKFDYPYHLSRKLTQTFPRQFPPSKVVKR